jgi:CubicO group peptidase (beta-lactamase class C family)
MENYNFEKLTKLLDNNSGQLYGKAVCAVSKNGKRVFSHSVNCAMDAMFDLASVSKILTGTMVLKLIGEGKLSLDNSIDTLFQTEPLGPVTKERFKAITLKQLLTHSSGLPAWFPFYTQVGSFWDVLEVALNKYPVEQGMVYSDLGFMLLGEAIRAASGLTLSQSLDLLNGELETSFEYNPKNPTACVETERGNRIEEGMCLERGLSFYRFRSRETCMRGEVNDGNAFYFWHGVAGHAGVFGIASDLFTLGELYLNQGKVNGKQLIPASLVEKSTIDYGAGRGLMWALSDIHLSDIYIAGFGHTGFTGTSLYLCRETGCAAAILTNRLVIEPAPDLRVFRTDAHRLIYSENFPSSAR